MSAAPPSNEDTARVLEEVANLLEAQGANPFRVRAYRGGAQTVRSLGAPVSALWQAEGVPGLLRLPGIGHSLANAIAHYLQSARLPLLERLRGENAPERILTSVANIGPELARRIHDALGIETLAELEAALYDGRLAQVPGMGKKRLQAVREALVARHRPPRPALAPAASPPGPAEPPVAVAELLDIDGQYRRLAAQDRLPRIAPRQFNPTGQAWLPVLHTHRGQRHYTALYSNTARAHELGATHDWVVIYRDDDEFSGRWTVITATFGKLRGRRVVRGHEADCERYYQDAGPAVPAAPHQLSLPWAEEAEPSALPPPPGGPRPEGPPP